MASRWPEGGVYGYNRDNLFLILTNPDPFLWFADHQDFTVSLLGAYGGEYLCQWVKDHQNCPLGVFDEYGDSVAPPLVMPRCPACGRRLMWRPAGWLCEWCCKPRESTPLAR